MHLICLEHLPFNFWRDTTKITALKYFWGRNLDGKKYEYFIPIRDVLYHLKLLQLKEIKILCFILVFRADIIYAAKALLTTHFIKVIIS